jgi:hemoglobin
MKHVITAALLALTTACPAVAAAEASPSPDEQVAGLEQMCDGNAAARAERHAARSLYERLGKEEGIHRLTTEIVRLHLANDQISHIFEGSYPEAVAGRVADFMVSGMGGPQVYTNRPTLSDSHRHMRLTNADFLAAGGDVIQAMKNLDYGQDEIDEVVCALVGLRDQVVLAEGEGATH